MGKYIKLIGDKISLATIDPDEADIFATWINTKNIGTKCGVWTANFTYDVERDFLDKIDIIDHRYTIVLNDTNETIGNISLKNISHINQSCALGIFIGDEKYHGKNYGFEAISLICDFAFNSLNINNISLDYFSFNESAKFCYEKVGFKYAGKFRDAHFYDGKRCDVIFMDLLRDEFNNNNKFSTAIK